MNQTRIGSLIEALINVAIGLLVSVVANAVVFPQFGFQPSMSENVAISLIYTAISIARQYVLRRFFNAILQCEAPARGGKAGESGRCMKPAYYNEINKFAAQWLRNLIAAGHIAPGDVDERSIEDVRADDLAGYRGKTQAQINAAYKRAFAAARRHLRNAATGAAAQQTQGDSDACSVD